MLDAKALAHANAGVASKSVQFGAWAESGMAADSNLSERARRAGLGLLTRRDGLRAIAEALRVDDVGVSDDDWNTSATSTTIATCPFDWERYKARHARASASSFLSEVGGDADARA